MKREPSGNQAADGERDDRTGRTPRDPCRRTGDEHHGRRHADESHAALRCKAAGERGRSRRNDLAPCAAETAATRAPIDINFVIAAVRCPLAALTGPQTHTIVHTVRSRIVIDMLTPWFFSGTARFPRATLRPQLCDLHELHRHRSMTNDLAGALPDRSDADDRLAHEFKNQMAIVVGFCDLLLSELPPDHPLRADLEQIHVASHAAVALLPRLLER